MRLQIVIERRAGDGWWVVAEGSDCEVWLPESWLPRHVDVDTVLDCVIEVNAAAQEALRREVMTLRQAVTEEKIDS